MTIMERSIAVIGGDGRYFALIRQLQSLTDTKIYHVDFDQLEQVDVKYLQPEKLNAVILPITGTDTDGLVEVVFSEKTIRLTKEWFKQLNSSTLIFTGIANDYLVRAANEANVSLIPLLHRDDV